MFEQDSFYFCVCGKWDFFLFVIGNPQYNEKWRELNSNESQYRPDEGERVWDGKRVFLQRLSQDNVALVI